MSASTSDLKLITFREAVRMTPSETVRHHRAHLNPRLLQLYEFIGQLNPPLRASGSYVWDSEGSRYLDFVSGYGALNLGHNHPRVCEALAEVADAPVLFEAPNRLASALAHNLAVLAPRSLDRVFFASAGSEVVDAAIKMARAATGRPALLACRNAFHGRTIGALSITDRTDYRENFEPLLPGVRFVDFGDLEGLEASLQPGDVAGFLVEPIQGEAGMIPAPQGYLREARRLCSLHGSLLILDEIQTGIGRTGAFLAVEQDEAVPDCILVGKSLGGGVAPLSALLTTDEVWRASKGSGPRSPFHHATFGGNTLSCAAGIVTLEVVYSEDLIGKALSRGRYLFERLTDLKARQPLLAEVRGRGLMLGVKLCPPDPSSYLPGALLRHLHEGMDAGYLFVGMAVRQLLLRHNVITAPVAHDPNVLRIQPPLNIEVEEIDYFVGSLESTLDSLSRFPAAVLKSLPAIVRFLCWDIRSVVFD
jgi:putrescine aminotransferase